MYISNLKKFYKYLKNLQIFSLNIVMCFEIVLVPSTYVQNYYSLKEIDHLEQIGEAGPP